MDEECYKDDPEVLDSDRLLRRLHPTQVVMDKNLGRYRPTSDAFEDNRSDDSPMSVDQAKLQSNDRDSLKNYPAHGLACFLAGFARENKQIIFPSPLEDNPAQTFVVGKKPYSIRQAFAKKGAKIVFLPEGIVEK